MTEYRISIIVEGHDRASAPLGQVGGSLGNIAQIAAGILSAQLFERIADGVAEIGRQALESYANYERLGMSLQALVGREMVNAGQAGSLAEAMGDASERAQELQGWIERLAIKSPFTQQGVADAFRTAMAYGFTTDEAQRMTQAMIDFAAGSGASEDAMGRIALALGQIKARGKLSGQEMLQLTNAGLSVTDTLAKAFGVTTEELVRLQQDGLIPADAAIAAIMDSMERDFGGSAERQAGTFSGLLSSLHDIKEVGLREFFEGVFQTAQPVLQQFVDLLTSEQTREGIRQTGQALGELLQPAAGWAMQLLATTASDGLFSPAFWVALAGGAETGLGRLSLALQQAAGDAQGLANGALTWLQNAFGGTQRGLASLTSFWEQYGPGLRQTAVETAQAIGERLGVLANQVAPWLVEQFNKISAWAVENGPLIQRFASTMSDAMVWVADAVTAMWHISEPMLSGLVDIALNGAKAWMQLATGDLSGAIETIGKQGEVAASSWEETVRRLMESIGAEELLWDNLLATWQGNLDLLGVLFDSLWNNFTTTWGDNLGMIGTLVETLWGQYVSLFDPLANDLETMWLEWVAVFTPAADLIEDGLGDLGRTFEWLNTEVLLPAQQAFEGVLGSIQGIIAEAGTMASSLADLQLPEWLQRHSPSPVEQTFGNWLEYTRRLNQELPGLQAGLPANDLAQAGQVGQQQNWDVTINYPQQTVSQVQDDLRLVQFLMGAA